MIDQKTKQHIFDLFAKVPGIISFSPVIVSVGPIPMNNDNRRAFSSPELMEAIADALIKEVNWKGIDVIVGAETAGMPLAFILSLKTRLPFCYVRKKKRGKGADLFVMGTAKKGDRAILIDDLISKGKTKMLFMENMRQDGIKTVALGMIWAANADLYLNDPARQELTKSGLPMYYLFAWEELIQALFERAIIPQELFPYYLDFIKHPQAWQQDPGKWDKYFAILRKMKIEIPQDVLEAVAKIRV